MSDEHEQAHLGGDEAIHRETIASRRAFQGTADELEERAEERARP